MKKIIPFFLVLIFAFSGLCVSAETSPFCTLDESSISADSYLLIEASTGTVVIEKNADKKTPMASITKLMVLLIADEYIAEGKLSLDEIITGTPAAKETPGSRIYLDDGEEMTLEDILKSISIPSANDAAVALAEHISGSEEAFVVLMNERAEKLGLKDTHYVTASGLDADGHYSTARDIAKLSLEIMLHHPMIMDHACIETDYIRGGEFPLINTNNLISTYKYATGLKTGTTDNAGYCLTATADKDGTKLVAVVLGSKSSSDRFRDARTLFEYAYSDFSVIKLQEKGELKDEEGNMIYAPVQRGNKTKVPLCVEKDLNAYIPSAYTNTIKVKYEIDENLVAPIPKGTVVGKVNIYANDILVDSQDAVTAQKIKKMNIFQALWHVLRAWLSL